MNIEPGENITNGFYDSLINALLNTIDEGVLIMKKFNSPPLMGQDYEIIYHNEKAEKILSKREAQVKYFSQISLFSHDGLHDKLKNNTSFFCDQYDVPFDGGFRRFDFCTSSLQDITILSFKEVTQMAAETERRINPNIELLNAIFDLPLASIFFAEPVKNAEDKIIDFEFRLINKLAEEMISQFKEGESMRSVKEIFQKNIDPKIFDRFISTYDSNIKYHYEFRYQLFGKEKWCSLIAVKVLNGLLLVISDITKNKQTEYELLQHKQKLENMVQERTSELYVSQEKFKLLALATHDAIYDWNLTNDHLWWNEGFKSYFGYKDEEMEHGIQFWEKKIHPEEKDKIINSLNQTLQTEEDTWVSEYRFSKADGTYSNIFDKGYIIRDNIGKPVRMLGAMFDISDLKRTQLELEKSNLTLKKINQDLDNFIYTASHDLKAPVSNIEGLVNSLKEILPGELFSEPEISSVFQMIDYSINRFRNTLNNLAEITKTQKDLDMKGRKELVDIHEAIENVKATLGEKFVDSALILENISNAPQLHFSKANIESLLFNLISNAIKYRHPDRRPVINIITKWADNFFILTVQDNGLGLKEEQKNKLFSSFKRFHNNIEGSGVGLYVVKRIVESSGGKIDVESEEGKGSTFRLFLKET